MKRGKSAFLLFTLGENSLSLCPVNILNTYKQCNALPMARVYLSINGIKSLSAMRNDFASDRRKPWCIWESTNDEGNEGFRAGEFRTKRDAVAMAKDLAQWVGIPFVS